jgi:hypothetical protein
MIGDRSMGVSGTSLSCEKDSERGGAEIELIDDSDDARRIIGL